MRFEVRLHHIHTTTAATAAAAATTTTTTTLITTIIIIIIIIMRPSPTSAPAEHLSMPRGYTASPARVALAGLLGIMP